MSLKQLIMDDTKAAMKAREKAQLATLRLLTAAIKQVEVDERKDLTDDEIISIVSKMIKQRKDSIAQFEQANRPDLIDQEAFEINILNTYLPEQLNEQEIIDILEKIILSTDARGMQDMGKVMGLAKAEVGAKADMSVVSKLVKQTLQKST